MEIREFGKTIEELYGLDFARLTQPVSPWVKVKKAITSIVTKIHGESGWKEKLMADLQKGRSIEDAMLGILVYNKSISLPDLATKLTVLRYSNEEIYGILKPKTGGGSEEDIYRILGLRSK